MKIIQKSNCFREIIQQWSIHDSSATINPGNIPAGTMLSVEQAEEDRLVCTVYVDHAFNAEVMAARKLWVMWSDVRGAYPALKFDITGWDADKLQVMQDKAQARLEKYKQASIEYAAAYGAYLSALAKQRAEIEAGTIKG